MHTDIPVNENFDKGNRLNSQVFSCSIDTYPNITHHTSPWQQVCFSVELVKFIS